MANVQPPAPQQSRTVNSRVVDTRIGARSHQSATRSSLPFTCACSCVGAPRLAPPGGTSSFHCRCLSGSTYPRRPAPTTFVNPSRYPTLTLLICAWALPRLLTSSTSESPLSEALNVALADCADF